MKNMVKKAMAIGVSLVILSSIATYAASIINYSVSTGLIVSGILNKVSSISAKGETNFVPYYGYEKYKSYVYVSARDSSGTTLNATQGYGQGYGTIASPDNAYTTTTQSGASTWMSTHRSNNISDYGYNLIKN